MANFYVSSVAWTNVTAWAATTAYTVGQYRRQLAAVTDANARVFKCTTAGTSGGSEPVWSLNNNATTNDGSVVWTQVGGQEANQAAGNWTAPLRDVVTASGFAGGGGIVFVSNDHAQSAAAQFDSRGVNPCICVSRVGAALPPVAADYSTGASITTTGANGMLIGSNFYGFTLACGTGSSAATITLACGTNGISVLENCALQLNTTSASSQITIVNGASAAFPGTARLFNTTMAFGNVGQGINFAGSGGSFEWADTPSAIQGATIPTTLLILATNSPASQIKIHGVDLSALNTTLTSNSDPWCAIDIYDCKLNSGLTLRLRGAADPMSYMNISNCDDSTSGTNYRLDWYRYHGRVQSNTQAVRTGGASDGTTAYSHKVTALDAGGAAPTISYPYLGPWMSRRYNTTGASKTITVEGIFFSTAVPDNLTAYMDVEVLNTAGVPLAGFLTTRQSFPFGTGGANTTSTAAWDTGTVAARQNSHAYILGDLIKLASNSGRLFECTAAGTTAGSEPGGYATAIDGGTVTDGSATFQAGWRLKFSVTATPQVAGVIRARINYAGSSNASNAHQYFYVDPYISIT